MAERAGVSIGTVDRVIHNRGEVSEKTREKILAIIKELNFEPDILASTLAMKKTYRFAVLLPEITKESTFWKAPQVGINRALNEISHYGVQVELFLFDQFEKISFRKNAAELIEYHPDAFVFTPVFADVSINLAQQAREAKIPFALINSNNDDVPKISYIGQDSYQSGKVAGKLMDLGLTAASRLLVVNISKALKNHKHILKRKAGFEAYFAGSKEPKVHIHTLNIENTEQESVDGTMLKHLKKNGKNYHGIFVTNSRVFKIAEFLHKNNLGAYRLIGYDLLEESMGYLENGTIDFLLSQQPYEQGYKGIMTLFHHVILHKEVKQEQYLPIDIITKENIKFYMEND